VIIEFGIAAGLVYGVKWIKNSKQREVNRQFIEIVQESGIENKSGIGYELHHINKTKYGYSAIIYIPKGMALKELEKIKEAIQINMKCLVEITHDKFKDYANVKIITNPLNNLKYKVEETKPYELLLGYKYTGESYKLNNNDDTSILIGGIRGSGKSRLESIALTTLLKNHDETEIEIYLLELLKKDLRKFRNMKQVKFFADTLKDSKIILEKIEKMLTTRSEKIDAFGCENIYDYNKKAKIKMKYVWIFADEYSLYMEEPDDTEEEKQYKASILGTIKTIAKLGRSTGIFFISGLQRSTVDNINSTVKSQMCRLSFAQLSELDSNNIIGIPDAKGLNKQECILFTGNEYVYLKTPYIDNKIINETLGIKEVDSSSVYEDKKNDRKQAVAVKAYFAGVLKEVATPIISNLTYEESQKLSTYSECITLENKPVEQPQEEVKEVIREIIEEVPKETNSKKPRKRPSGTVRKEVKEVAISETNR
jgi:hypothetical protein